MEKTTQGSDPPKKETRIENRGWPKGKKRGSKAIIPIGLGKKIAEIIYGKRPPGRPKKEKKDER